MQASTEKDMMACTRFSAKYFFGVLLAFIFLFAISQNANAQSPALEKLDRILVEAGSVKNFLFDKNAQTKYFQVLARYIGADKIPRADFDAHIEDLKKVLAAAPELEQRLWSTEGLGRRYQVELVNKSSGLDLDQQKWNAFKDEYLKTLNTEAGLVHEIKDKPKQSQFVKDTLETLNKSIQEIQNEKYPDIENNSKTSPTVKEKQIYSEKGKKLKALFDVPQNKATLAYLKEMHLMSEAKQDILRTTDADLAIALIEDIHKADSYAKIGEYEIPPEVRGKIAGYNKFKIDTSITIDPQTKKAVDKGFFKVRLNAQGIPVGRGQIVKVVAEPIPRRFHGVWKDYMVKSCVRDQCNNYLTAALKDTEVHFIERVTDGGQTRSSNGFTQTMKFHDPRNADAKPLSVIDIMSPEFNLDGQMVHPRTGNVEKLPILEWMVKEYSKDQRLYVSESGINSNGGNLELLEASPGYKFSKPSFEASTLKLVDPDAGALFQKVKPFIPEGVKFLGWTHNPYKDNWVSEATQKDSGHLRRLTSLDSASLKDPKVMESLLANVEKIKDPKLKLEVLIKLLEQTPWPESFWQKVPALLYDSDESVRLKTRFFLSKQPDWPKSFWQNVPDLLRDQNVPVRPELAEYISYEDLNEDVRKSLADYLKPEWPESFWKEVPSLLQGRDRNVRLKLAAHLKYKRHWPESFWKEVPSLLQSTDQHVRLILLSEALMNRSDWRESVLQTIPKIWSTSDSRVRLFIAYGLMKQVNWPESIWEMVPKLLQDHYLDTVYAVISALKDRPHWPQSLIDELSKPGPDGKSLAEKLNLTEELEKRRSRPPLTPLKSFDCPLLKQKVAAKMKAL
jgi:hypothetical protein